MADVSKTVVLSKQENKTDGNNTILKGLNFDWSIRSLNNLSYDVIKSFSGGFGILTKLSSIIFREPYVEENENNIVFFNQQEQ